MSEIVKVCRKHGELTLDLVYVSKDKNLKNGFAYKCKKCTYEALAKRPCKIHGELSPDDRVASGACRICAFVSGRKANEKRDNNREEFNAKERLKRQANPEAWKLDRKRQYERAVSRIGLDNLNEMKKAQKRGITVEKLRGMISEQNNLCAICNQPETRIFNKKGMHEGGMKIAQLCIDHDHETGFVRGLLCHDCNIALGKMKDDVTRLQSAINYLNKSNELQRENAQKT